MVVLCANSVVSNGVPTHKLFIKLLPLDNFVENTGSSSLVRRFYEVGTYLLIKSNRPTRINFQSFAD